MLTFLSRVFQRIGRPGPEVPIGLARRIPPFCGARLQSRLRVRSKDAPQHIPQGQAGVGTVLIREWRGVSHRVTVLDREQETGAVVLSRRESSQRRDSMIVMHRTFQPSPTGPLDFEATIEWTLLM